MRLAGGNVGLLCSEGAITQNILGPSLHCLFCLVPVLPLCPGSLLLMQDLLQDFRNFSVFPSSKYASVTL